jgi:RNA polymerase sigma-70 factor (ECF subfamily)
MDQTGTLTLELANDLDGHFETMVIVYQERIYRFALRLAGNSQDAEEIAQDAFVRAYRALKQYPRERVQSLTLRPWLYQICLNVFRNRVRRRSFQVMPLDGDLYAGSERERPERVAEIAEGNRELAHRLATLPERYRAAVILRHIEELGIAEIATVLKQPEGTVKSNIHRGMQQLRQTVETERRMVTQ